MQNKLTKSFFLITVLTLLGCNPSEKVPVGVDDAGSRGNQDLVVSVTANPAIIASGNKITLSATVTNKGTATSDSTILFFYSSDDNIISNSDNQIGNVKLVSILDPDKTEINSAMITGHSTGIKYYGACVKALSDESNKNNNCSTGVRVTVGIPDLAVSSFTATPPTISSGGTVNLTATVRNSGNFTANSTTLRYHRSTSDNNINDSGTPIATDDISNLLANSSSDATANVTGHSSGIYYYWACVVAVSSESNIANNCSVAKAIRALQPDLVVSSFTVSETTIDSGETVNLSATITNSGDLTADSTTLRFFRSRNNSISDSGNPIATDDISNLSADSSDNISASVTGHSSGIYYYWACVGVVSSESNTVNNCSIARAITALQPDLAVSRFTASPAIISSGETVHLSATVTNSGNGAASSTTLRFLRSQNNNISASADNLVTTDSISRISANSSNASADNLVTTDSISRILAGGSNNVIADVTGHSIGIYYYWACVGAVSGESNPNNNCSIARAVTVGVPDLVVSVTASPTIIASGDNITLSAIVTNSGNLTANSTILRYYRSTSNTISDSGTPIATDDISNLSANSSSDAIVDVTGYSTGIYYWACVVAVSGETTTDNNCSSSVAVGPVGFSWQQSTASADWSARVGKTSVVFDNKIWVLGGSFRNDVWSSSNGISWTEATDGSLRWSARRDHTSIVFKNKIWVLGGCCFYNDVWSSSNGTSWTQAKPNDNDVGWLDRQNHTSVVFDNKMWVLGGCCDGSSLYNDVWSSVDGTSWTEVTASVDWTARWYHTSNVFDNKMWVLGGRFRGDRLNDVWFSSNGNDWTEATDGSARWSARSGHNSIAFDNKIWVLGGDDGFNKNDVWSSSNGTNWTEVTSSANWTDRQQHTSIAFDNKIWVLGGASRKNDVWFSGINNNDFDRATFLNVGSKSLNSHSAILTAGTSDFYQISLTAGNLIVGDWTFSTQSSIDTDCELYDNLQRQLVTINNSTSGDCSITYPINVGGEGDYYIKISGGGNNSNSVTGNYTLKITPPTD